MAFRRRTKSYPLFSQEFVIHNHADIGFCLVLCVLIGLMFEVTAKTAFLFILPQYNVSVPTADSEAVRYHYGPKDLATVSFYIFIAVILHAVVQEYILDKISKRLHLSKVKHSKFNESGQLVVFHLSSVVWCFYVVVTEGYLTNPRSLWEDYPHVYLPFQVKFFYLCQLAYWLHALPELYFQKVRKEEIPRQLLYICLYLVHIAGAYLLKCVRPQRQPDFPAVSCPCISPHIHLIRLCVLLLVCAAQAWLMWRFIHSQLRHWREHWNEQSAKRRAPVAPRLPARLLKRDSGVTPADSAGWAAGGGHPVLLWCLPCSSSHLSPPRVSRHCQSCTFCPARGPVCTRICFLTHLPCSRCGLLGKGSYVLEPDTCVAACAEESGLAAAGRGSMRLQPYLPL
nr:translocating chain-associated membrane protein 2 [Manis javanica]